MDELIPNYAETKHATIILGFKGCGEEGNIGYHLSHRRCVVHKLIHINMKQENDRLRFQIQYRCVKLLLLDLRDAGKNRHT